MAVQAIISQKQIIFLVVSIPVQAVTPSGPAETCGGNVYEYTTTEIPNADEYFWQVDPSDAGTISGTGTNASFQASGTWAGAYDIKVRAVNECGNGDYSPVLNAILYESPDMFFIDGGGDYCEGGTGAEILLDGSETGVDYELFLDAISTGTILPGTGSILNFGYQTDAGFYTIEGQNTNCTLTMGGQALISIIIPPGTPGTPYGPDMVCNHESTIYTTTGSQNADTLIWSLSPPEAGSMQTGMEPAYN